MQHTPPQHHASPTATPVPTTLTTFMNQRIYHNIVLSPPPPPPPQPNTETFHSSPPQSTPITTTHAFPSPPDNVANHTPPPPPQPQISDKIAPMFFVYRGLPVQVLKGLELGCSDTNNNNGTSTDFPIHSAYSRDFIHLQKFT
ncbi:hypothetical protein E2C01_048834 [Portunus trituberculatus]|uniref:Uncharacterized protein n=1 Tax=Portunus trituberculatus TaxID=210409 RepID=A0A5B7GC39_PORTR|nr:hypothetical protein [Portunus trituberculatus]